MTNRRPPELGGPYRTEVAAVVKWYNPTKGFGFVKPQDGAPDAFLHASLVAQAGYESLADGSLLICDITEGPRGPQVAMIHSVEPPSEPVVRSRPPRRPMGGPYSGGFSGGYSGGPGATVEGTVKFYNAEKGFGFITPDDGSKDVFVSARTLTRAGMPPLVAEQRVRVTTRMGQKGPMAESVELL
jgi:cold shock protein